MSKIISTVWDYQEIVRHRIEEGAYGYYISGSDDEVTLKNNVDTFSQIYLMPRVLINMEKLTLKTKILGHQLKLPFGFAPIAMQKLIHPEGELLSAKQAYQQNTAYTVSMLTTTKVSEIARVNPTGMKIMQLYFQVDAEYTKEVIKLAEKNGFIGLAITVDTQTFGKRRKDQRKKFSPQVELELYNQLGIDVKFKNYTNPKKSFVHQIKRDLTWEDIKWIKQNTHLKIILKGLISTADVDLAEKYGVDAIWISNHGGRQLDTSPATVLAIKPIRNRITQIKSQMELFVDGGVRTGEDVFKCLALGADFVFLGRAFLFSLTEGEKGVQNAIGILKEELRKTMMLCGTRNVGEIDYEFIHRTPSAKL